MTENATSPAWARYSTAFPNAVDRTTDFFTLGPDLPSLDHRLFGDLRGKRVVDLGCGMGHGSIALARQGAKVIAVDADPTQIAHARVLAEQHAVKIELHHADLADIAGRHPGASFVSMHSGGNWEVGIRTLRNFPNVALEVSGSTPTAGFVEMAVREVGAQRVTYGTDTSGRSMSTQMAKVLGAGISREDKFLIFGGNLRRLFAPIMQAKGMKLA